MSNTLQTFQNILNDTGLMPSEIIADGELRRCPTQTKPHKQNARISPTLIPRLHFGGATGKAVNKARFPKQKKEHSPQWKKRHYSSAKRP